MQTVKVLFFGSTEDSVLVLETLASGQLSTARLAQAPAKRVSCQLCAVVTQPPRKTGRKQIVTATPVQLWARAHDIPVLSFESNTDKPWVYADENQVIDALQPFKADLIVSACYGQKIPQKTIYDVPHGGLNVHPSLLPRWRGADPVPWAIYSGDHQTAVTIVTLSKEFDDGVIVSQKKISILDTDTSDPLRTKLFTIGAKLLEEVLSSYLSSRAKRGDLMQAIASSKTPRNDSTQYARRLTRDDGFEPWELVRKAFSDPEMAVRIDRKFRAFTPWPGVWTKFRIRNHKLGIMEEKRLKILACHLTPPPHRLMLETVQLEGKRPVSWDQFTKAYVSHHERTK
ncbi:methionyl-tRNA formyltransferase [Candidatus Gottesmanbacteria bacterium]|nr:methionyl-tRNA formyltransferase [Candidatus Gottesmanbacteria bacterium]